MVLGGHGHAAMGSLGVGAQLEGGCAAHGPAVLAAVLTGNKGAFNEEPEARAGTCGSSASPRGPKHLSLRGRALPPAAGDVAAPLAERSLFWSLSCRTGQGNNRLIWPQQNRRVDRGGSRGRPYLPGFASESPCCRGAQGLCAAPD